MQGGERKEERLVPLRMDTDRRWKEAGEGNPDPWVGGGKGV